MSVFRRGVGIVKNKQTEDNTNFSGLKELLNTEVMKNYNEFIVSEAVRHSNGLNQVIDFGAGIGTLSLILKNCYGVDTQCVEIDSENKAYLSRRNLKQFDCLNDIKGKSDLIFSSNVLEHIEDDVSVLVNMKDKLSESGKIYLYLPAKMLLWSRLDEEVGHFRRYEISEIENKCKQAGLKVEFACYADSLGFFASLLMTIIGYNAEGGIGSVGSLIFYDKWIFPLSRMLDRLGFKYLFGKNLIAVVKKAN